MRTIQNSEGPNSDSDFSSNSVDFEEDFGWSSNVSYDDREFSKEKNISLIKLANKKSSLLKHLKDLNIRFEIIHSPSGWTHKSKCPFPDHKDSSPSFFYNSIDDYFKCHGCHRTGRTVELLSVIKNKKKTVVAQEIIDKLGNVEDVYETIYNETDDNFDILMEDAAKTARDFLNNHRDKKYIKIIENLYWNLDLYIERSFGTDLYDSNDLEKRINYIKDRLKKYEQELNSR